ncbi:DgyrCDS7567 [Dimorphilus gyrociliatus]|uniref:DgyrCDS7567 n=1 Tax=Dimorphilus gyrociliatus TaxID=2664684 RepID=A0A7I8VT42_9ANNE|nr:DgyrCDS7567 [Dimorphilus gyrociliatus]
MASSIVLKDRGIFRRTRSGNYEDEGENHEVTFDSTTENQDIVVGENSREYAMNIPIDNTNDRPILTLICLISFIYGLCLITLGIGFPVVEISTRTWGKNIPVGIFLVYLYVIATIFLVYCHFFIVEPKRVKEPNARIFLKYLIKGDGPSGDPRPARVSINSTTVVHIEHRWNDLHSGTNFYLRLGALGCFIAIYNLWKFSHKISAPTVDDVLLLIGLAGNFILEFVIAGSNSIYIRDNGYSLLPVLSIVSSLLSISQSIFQSLIIPIGLRVVCKNPEDREEKPGRQAITFILLGNVALWASRSFEAKELQMETVSKVIGQTMWLIVLNVSSPLLLFFRFHSSVCFAHIWKHAYQPDNDN